MSRGSPNWRRLAEIALYGSAPISALVTAPVLARGLGPEGRGQFGVAQSLATFCITLGALGQADVLLANARQKRANIARSSRIALGGALASSALALLGMTLLGLPVSVGLATVIVMPLLSQSAIWRSVSVAEGELTRPAVNSASASISRAAFFLGLYAATGSFSVEVAIGSYQVLGALAAIATVGSLSLARRSLYVQEETPWRELFRAGWPLIAFSTLTAVTLRADVVVLQLAADPREVGEYAASSGLTTSVLAISVAFKTRLQRALFAVSDVNRKALKELRLAVGVALVVAATGAVASPWVVAVMFGAEYSGAVPILRVLSVAAGGLVVLDVVHGGLVVLGQRRELVTVAAVGAGLTVLMLWLLVPTNGSIGAAVATLVAYATASTFGAALLLRRLGAAR